MTVVLFLVALVLALGALVLMPPRWVRALMFVIVLAGLLVGAMFLIVRLQGGWSWLTLGVIPFLLPWVKRIVLWWGVRRMFSPNARWGSGRTEGSGRRGGSSGTRMDVQEALAVLGLDDSAGPITVQRVHEAYRRMMNHVHPDKGGSDYMAAKINQARDVLIGHLGA